MNDKQIELKKLKEKFSEFISVGNDIKRLHGMHCIAPKCAPNDTEGYRFKHIELVNSFLDDKTEVSNVVTGATVRICGKVPKVAPNAIVVELGPPGQIEVANIAISSTVETRTTVSIPEVTLNATSNEFGHPNPLPQVTPKVTPNATVVELGPPGQIEIANIAIGSTVETCTTVSIPEVTLNATSNEFGPGSPLDYYFSANRTATIPQVTPNATIVELGPSNSYKNCLGYSQPDKRPNLPNNMIDGQIDVASILIGSSVETRTTVSIPEVTLNATSNEFGPPNPLDYYFSPNRTVSMPEVTPNATSNEFSLPNPLDYYFSANQTATTTNVEMSNSYLTSEIVAEYESDNIVFDANLIDAIVSFNTFGNTMKKCMETPALSEVTKNATVVNLNSATSNPSYFTEESMDFTHDFMDLNDEHIVALDDRANLHEYEMDIDVDVTTVQIDSPSNLTTSKADCDVMECGTTIDVKRNRGCDNSNMYVPTSDSGPKKYCCMYCRVRVQKLERHLRNVHKNEKDVKRYLAFAPHSRQRRELILRIQKQGDFIWNSDEKLNEGEYAVRRRPNKKFTRKPWDMIPCPACLGSYSKSYLTRHWNKECAKNPLIGERIVHQLGRAVDGRLYKDASDDLVDLFATFRKNQNIQYVRFDWLVICYGNELCMNHSPHYQKDYICGKLRAAAKVLRTSKSIATDISDMASLFHVKHCNTVVDAIRTMGKFDGDTKLFGSPGTASTTVTLINSIGDMLLTEYMKMDDPEKERDVERFLKVFKRDVKSKISKLVAVSTLDKKRQKEDEDIIPTTADVLKFAKYLDLEREACFSRLVQQYSYDDWLRLSNLTLVSILVYNRRRAGEMQNILLSDFERRKIIADQSEMILSQITEATQRNIKSRLNVRNKLGKKLVPVLLKHNWDDCLALLVRHRTDAGICENNKFLFALPTQSKRIKTENACSLMRSLSVSCGAENPKSLRGTLLRKHMATFSSTKNLSDSDISFLADFMGHAEAVHRTYYRVNTLANQVGKISVLLDSALGNENPRDSGTADGNGKVGVDGSEDDNGDDSEVDSDECYEFESDSETEAVASVNATRRTVKKPVNMKKKPNVKAKKANAKPKKANNKPKKPNVKPNKVPKSRKKTVPTIEVKNKKKITKKGKMINKKREVK